MPEGNLILNPTLRLKQLSDVGSAVTVDNAVPAQRYLRSGPQMEKMARTYYAEGQLEQAFILYNKFATLFVEKLPKHSGYNKAPVTDRSRIKKLLKPAFERAMDLKERLKIRYEEEKKMFLKQQRQQEIEQKTIEENEKKHEQSGSVPVQLSSDLATVASSGQPTSQDLSKELQPTTTTNLEDNQQTAELCPDAPPKIQNQDADTGMKCTINVENFGEDDSEDTGGWAPCDDALLLSNVQTFFYDDYEESNEDEVSETGLTATNEDLCKVLPDGPTPTRVDHPATLLVSKPQQQQQPIPTNPPPTIAPHPSSQVVPANAEYTPPPAYALHPSAFSPHSSNYSSYNQQPVSTNPACNPHDPYLRSSSYPQMQPNFVAQTPATPPAVSARYPPIVDRSVKPQNVNLKPHVLTSLGGLEGGIRPIILPNDVSSRFLTMASPNTRKNIETCGIIGGKLERNKFRVSHIIIPKQTGQSDSCETVNEEEIFAVQDKYDLITLGWIHTHPSQTSFMSSVDLHTHCSYQLMLEEAIAIVCAPKYSQVGVFTLTQPHGLSYISKCSGKGFHTHPKEPPIYEDCPHVEYDGSVSIQIIDLR